MDKSQSKEERQAELDSAIARRRQQAYESSAALTAYKEKAEGGKDAGMSNAEIAKELGLKESTVRTLLGDS